MKNIRVWAVILLIFGALVGFFVYASQKPNNGFASNFPFKLGLDLNGGTHLEYQADVSKVDPTDVAGAMSSLRDVIENRINVFGVSEPLVQVDQATVNGQNIEKLIVELPGVTDVGKAVSIIGQTPVLDFRSANKNALTGGASSTPAIATSAPASASAATSSATPEYSTSTGLALNFPSAASPATAPIAASSTVTASATVPDINTLFTPTGLTGRYLEKATLEFDPQTNAPIVSLQFNAAGTALFAQITQANIGNVVGIFLDGRPISTPVVRDAITNGQAEITGGFTPEQAKELVQNLNYGALPVPITLIGTETIGASLGLNALHASILAGIWGFVIIALFLILWYRLPGLVAVVSLLIYTALNLAIYKLIPVTLTSAGLAGFILSIGMAVDANILIFERMKEEFARGFNIEEGIREGFSRAWFSIRDGNLSSIITAIILFWFATTALIKGFALVFGIGVVVSMFTAVTISRTFLLAIAPGEKLGKDNFLFGSGFRRSEKTDTSAQVETAPISGPESHAEMQNNTKK
jgi:preprotein translocase subunit SecD